jgi:hypothetical protein
VEEKFQNGGIKNSKIKKPLKFCSYFFIKKPARKYSFLPSVHKNIFNKIFYSISGSSSVVAYYAMDCSHRRYAMTIADHVIYANIRTIMMAIII